MRVTRLVVLLFLAAPAAARALPAPPDAGAPTRAIRFAYRAHDGVVRPGWLLLPSTYRGQPIPLVISPHGRGVSATGNALLWGDLPGLGDFAVVNPGGEGRRTHLYSWGDPGQIRDLARMPEIVERLGVHLDRHRIYAVGGSMGGQETLLLVARHPTLLAGAIAFDAPTDMARRYWDFASLPEGRELRAFARDEFGGTPLTAPDEYAERSPDTYAREIALSGVPLQLFWSVRDRVIADQTEESAVLAGEIRGWNPNAKLWTFRGAWNHTAEMRPWGRLPRALARFGLFPPSLVPALPDDVHRHHPVPA